MKLRTQLVILILSILFSVSAALAVSVHGLKLLQSPDPIPWPDPPTSPPTLDATDSSTSDEPPTDAPSPTPSGKELLFFSNGNGTCALIGIGTYNEKTLIIPERAPSGEKVTSISARALYGCSTLESIHLPRSILSIGELAFSNCPSLSSISVHAENPFYCDLDGVLYSADLAELLLYPPSKAAPTVTLPASLRMIRDMAFSNCLYLSTVIYSGSASDWQEVLLGSRNDSLVSATLLFAPTE